MFDNVRNLCNIALNAFSQILKLKKGKAFNHLPLIGFQHLRGTEPFYNSHGFEPSGFCRIIKCNKSIFNTAVGTGNKKAKRLDKTPF